MPRKLVKARKTMSPAVSISLEFTGPGRALSLDVPSSLNPFPPSSRCDEVCVRVHFGDLPAMTRKRLMSENRWLGGRESNPDMLVQSQLSYH
jgi:hypothetical protein